MFAGEDFLGKRQTLSYNCETPVAKALNWIIELDLYDVSLRTEGDRGAPLGGTKTQMSLS